MNSQLKALLKRHPELIICQASVQTTFDVFCNCFRQGGKLLVCGNGGSAADSEHIVGELMKGYRSARRLSQIQADAIFASFPDEAQYLVEHLQGALPAISLASQTALLTAYANDVAADMAFAQQVFGYGRVGDIFLGISTSGDSKNVIHAAQVARATGLYTICLTGQAGGELKSICETAICVPETQTARVQELHVAVYHTLCEMLEDEFFGEQN